MTVIKGDRLATTVVDISRNFRGYLVLQGLAGRVGDYFFTTQEGIELLSRQKMLNFPSGEKYVYSNSRQLF